MPKAVTVNAETRRIKPIADAIGRDVNPLDVITQVLVEIRQQTGAEQVYMLVRPVRLARAFGMEVDRDRPAWLSDGVGCVSEGDIAEEIVRFEGSTEPLRLDGGARVLIPSGRGGLRLEKPNREAIDDADRMTLVQVLAGLAAGMLHSARRIDEGRQRQRALEVARERLGEQNALLQELAVIDELTGLNNRRSFSARLDEEIRRVQRYGRPLSLALFDVDWFKQVNDTYGHERGDVVLKVVSDCSRRAARKVDLCARLGGDEFAILMPETDAQGGLVVAERLRTLLATTPNPVELGDVRVTLSIGVASATAELAGDGAALMRAADEALYRSKQAGRDRVTLAIPPVP